MSPSEFFWWVGAGALIVAELLTGTFYLLMIALEFIAGALADLAGTGPAAQYAIAALVALAAVLALRRTRYGRRRPQRDTSANPDMNPDVGATLEVPAWRDGRARVQYRGCGMGRRTRPGHACRRTSLSDRRSARQPSRRRGKEADAHRSSAVNNEGVNKAWT
jgi:membrane protein implicated in regulation of membrane protease activity